MASIPLGQISSISASESSVSEQPKKIRRTGMVSDHRYPDQHPPLPSVPETKLLPRTISPPPPPISHESTSLTPYVSNSATGVDEFKLIARISLWNDETDVDHHMQILRGQEEPLRKWLLNGGLEKLKIDLLAHLAV